MESRLNTMKRSGLKSLKKEASTLLTLVLFLKVNIHNSSTISTPMERLDSKFGVTFTDAA